MADKDNNRPKAPKRDSEGRRTWDFRGGDEYPGLYKENGRGGYGNGRINPLPAWAARGPAPYAYDALPSPLKRPTPMRQGMTDVEYEETLPYVRELMLRTPSFEERYGYPDDDPRGRAAERIGRSQSDWAEANGYEGRFHDVQSPLDQEARLRRIISDMMQLRGGPPQWNESWYGDKPPAVQQRQDYAGDEARRRLGIRGSGGRLTGAPLSRQRME